MSTADATPAFCDIPRERLAREGVVRVRAGDVEILAAETAEGIRVYSGICPHLGGPLLDGEVRDGTLICPWHGYQFDLATARCRSAPGRPWRSLVGGAPGSDEPWAFRLAALHFDEAEGQIRVHLPRPGAAQ